LTHSLTFSVTAVVAIGLAIGSTGAIFSLVDGLWLRPAGIRDPGSLVWLFSTRPTEPTGGWSWPEYTAMRDRLTSVDDVAARGRRGAILTDASERADLVLVNVVSHNFFTMLGVNAAHGRVFGSGDADAMYATPGVVLGHAFWTRRFGADRAMVGRTIALGTGKRVPVTILGVLPPSFRELSSAADRDVWMPPETWRRLAGDDDVDRDDHRWFDVVARRRPGISKETAHAELSALATAFARDDPAGTARSARVVSDFDLRLERGGVNATGLLALVLLVVAITCVNVANLLLARTADRARELAVRVAVGAGRRHLVRYLAAESLLLGAAGGALGLLVSLWLVRLLPWVVATPPGFRDFADFTPDARMMAFTLAIAAFTTLLFALAPIWTATRSDLAGILRTGPVSPGGARSGALRSALVMAQVAISMVLVACAAVLGRSFVETTRADLGFTREPVLTAWIAPVDLTPVLSDQVSERLAALPGVAGVGVAVRAPLSLSGGGMARPVALVGASADVPVRSDVKYTAVSATYFDVMRTRLVQGRFFTRDEERGGERVAVVNEAFVAAFLPGGEAVGRLVLQGAADRPHRIVGVAGNAVINTIGEPAEPYLYLPYFRDGYGDATFLIRTQGQPPPGLAMQIVQALRGVDPRLDPPRGVISMSEYVDYGASPYEASAALATGLAAIGLLLTAIGVYGVIAYRTTRRTREIGIRMALGAPRAEILNLILRDGVRIAGAGVAIGIPAALAATRMLESVLFGVHPWDTSALVAAVSALSAAVGLATLLPAWRAVRLTPVRALREG
jgi:predicted permease